MAGRTFTLDIVTPERVILHDEVTSVVAPGVLGAFGVLANHAPLLSELSIGELRYRRDSAEEVRLAVGGGFLQVFNNQVTVLADSAERANEIDMERARRALELSRQAMREATGIERQGEHDLAQESQDRALNRIRVAGG